MKIVSKLKEGQAGIPINIDGPCFILLDNPEEDLKRLSIVQKEVYEIILLLINKYGLEDKIHEDWK